MLASENRARTTGQMFYIIALNDRRVITRANNRTYMRHWATNKAAKRVDGRANNWANIMVGLTNISK